MPVMGLLPRRTRAVVGPGVNRPPNGADSEREPRPLPGTTLAPDGADSDISARVTGHITAPAQHTYHVTAGPSTLHMHVLRDPARASQTGRRKYVITAGPTTRLDRSSLQQEYTHPTVHANRDGHPWYVHPSARSRYELSCTHTATGHDSAT